MELVAYKYRFFPLGQKRSIKLEFSPQELTFLPSGEKRVVQLHELQSLIKRVGYPWSMLAAYFAGVSFIDYIPGIPTFINVVLVEGVPTTLEIYRPDKGILRFGDFSEGWRHVTNVVVATNAFRQQFRYLAQVLPYDFYEYRYKNGRNAFFAPVGKLGIDLTFFSKWATGKKPFRLAAELGVPSQDPLALTRYLYDYLDVPELFRVFASVLNIDRNYMQLAFDDALKAYIVYQAYLDHGYIIDDRPKEKCEEGYDQVYVRKPGLYYDMVEYDVSSAYPTTVIVDRVDPYNTEVFPSLMRKLLSLRDKYRGKSTFAERLAKGIANSLIGMLKYELSYFRNVCAWQRVINGFYNRWAPIAENSVWASVDSAIVPSSVDAPELDGYTVREKHRFYWVAVLDNNRLVGRTVDDEIITKGLSPERAWGGAVRFPRVFLRARDKLEQVARYSPDLLFKPCDEVVEYLRELIRSSLTDDPEDYVALWVRARREEAIDPVRARVLFRLPIGVAEGVLTPDGFSSEPDLSSIDWNFYIEAMVYSLMEYFQCRDYKRAYVLISQLRKEVVEWMDSMKR